MSNVFAQYGMFSDTIYIEDKFTHTNYNSPANRFYECLSTGVYIHFDFSCLLTFNKAGIDIKPFIVDGHKDIENKLHNTELIKLQKEILYDGKDYLAELDSDIETLVKPIVYG
jgi:hypothetical protein